MYTQVAAVTVTRHELSAGTFRSPPPPASREVSQRSLLTSYAYAGLFQMLHAIGVRNVKNNACKKEIEHLLFVL